MNRLHCLLAAALVAMLGACAQPPAKPDTQAMIAAAEKLDQAFVDAFNKGDADALAALYWNSPDVVSFPPDTMMAQGPAAIKAAVGASFASMKGAKLEIADAHYIPTGEVVLSWGTFKLAVPAADGKSTELKGRYTDVKAERDGKWVYLMDHGSAPLPPPPAPPPAAK